MDMRRCLVVQASVGSTVVVDPNSLVDCSPGLVSGIEGPAESEFLLEDSIESFGVSVFVAVVFFSHAHWKISTLENFYVLMAAVLAAAVRMVNWISVCREILDGPIQCDEV